MAPTAPLDSGSCAAELAACSVAVGLAHRPDVRLAAITGPVEAVEHATVLLSGTLIAPGGAYVRGGTAWCASSADRLLAVAEGAAGDALPALIERVAGPHPALRARTLTGVLTAAELLGPRVEATLAALGVPPTLPPAVQTVAVRDLPITVVRRSWSRALLLVDPLWAAQLRRVVEQAGAPSGIVSVGPDAVARFRFVEPLLA